MLSAGLAALILSLAPQESPPSSRAVEDASRFLAEGRPSEAVRALAEALRFELGRPGGADSRGALSELLDAWGVAMTHLGEFELAEQSFAMAADEAEDAARKSFLAMRRAGAIRAAGDPEKALRMLEERAPSAEGPDRYAAAFFRSQRGNALEDLGRLDEAIEEYERARSLWAEIGEKKQEAYERKTTGDALRKRGSAQAALEQVRTARGILETLPHSPVEIQEFLVDEALVLADLGRSAEALEGLERSLEALERWRKEASRAGRATHAFGLPSVSRALAAWVGLKAKLHPEGAAEATLSRVERFRALGLLRPQRASSAVEKIERRRSLLRRKLELFFDSERGRSREELRRELARAFALVASAEFLLGPWKVPEPPKPFPPVPAEGRAILDYFASPDGAYLWVGLSSGWSLFPLADRKETESFFRELDALARNLARRPGRDSDDLGAVQESLRALLIPPEAARLLEAASSFWIVPDGLLYQVPFAALTEKEGKGLPPISVYPSLMFAAAWRWREGRPYSPEIAIFAAPEVEAPGLDPLRYAEEEARRIASRFPPSATRLLLGEEASESAYTAYAASRRNPGRLLHFAAHGLFSPSLEGGSAVLLTADESEDGWLWASEIAARPLGAGFCAVVLSSCYSASGEWVAGEGVLGLSRAFLQAGARAVVGSLWAVDQKATGLLMDEFYRRLASGAPLAESLAGAQEALQKDPRYSHPYFWAAFRVEGDGNWAPFADLPKSEPASTAGFSWWTWSLAAAVAAFLLWAVFRRKPA